MKNSGKKLALISGYDTISCLKIDMEWYRLGEEQMEELGLDPALHKFIYIPEEMPLDEKEKYIGCLFGPKDRDGKHIGNVVSFTSKGTVIGALYYRHK